MSCSVRLSSALVASSSSRIGGFLTSVRAMATRCFSPPESFSPLVPASETGAALLMLLLTRSLARLYLELGRRADAETFYDGA